MKYIKDITITLFQCILFFLPIFIVYEMVLYIGIRYSNIENFQPFELATVTALLGGFALVGGFSSNSRVVNLAFALRKIGAIYIIATVAFFIFGLSMPLTEKTLPETLINQAVPIAVASFYLGAFLFSIATCWFIWVIPRIFKDN